ncbi:hypothetical protein Tsubulata_007379 [Turnera subulata]|uniref:Uncharacterized protein n=1 Tax=Turnera subulata TaxID=218843 RepID=A0A9Q0F9H2_9ROSI|nr:hypothetical protein Tsubulata_007379 [Turnera subulata]
MEQNSRDQQLLEIFSEHESAMQLLEEERRKIEHIEVQMLQRGVVQNDAERRELQLEKKMIENATSDLMKAHDEVLNLAMEQKKEWEELFKEMIELEKKIEAQHAMELEIEIMKGALHVIEHMGNYEDIEVIKMIRTLQQEIKGTEEALDAMEHG